jgi:hypothetical protein
MPVKSKGRDQTRDMVLHVGGWERSYKPTPENLLLRNSQSLRRRAKDEAQVPQRVVAQVKRKKKNIHYSAKLGAYSLFPSAASRRERMHYVNLLLISVIIQRDGHKDK